MANPCMSSPELGGHNLASESFHLVTVGWDLRLISDLWDRIENGTGFELSHIIVAEGDLHRHTHRQRQRRIYHLKEDPQAIMPTADADLLDSLERADLPTIHNMIMSDRVVRTLPYGESIAYATYLAHRFTQLYQQLEPSVVIGGFDGLHGGIGLAVARKLQIPWFAMHFSPLVKGMSGFCVGLTPRTDVVVQTPSETALRTLAEQTLNSFEKGEITVPAYLSANTGSEVVRRLPQHLRVLSGAVRRTLRGDFDRFTDYSVLRLCKDYLRKRINLLALPTHWFYEEPPTTPYAFFALHMQPESTVDVWAPFYSNQFHVIKTLARSIPTTHQLLVKLHKSDADNYSRRQLGRLRQMPGVRLVSPFVPSRAFIDNASIVVAIQGTIALEAALLGKPVVMFGESRVLDLPSVSKVYAITELPDLIRHKLREPRPAREAILDGFMSYLSHFAPGCYNDWTRPRSESEIANLVEQFKALRKFVAERRTSAP